MSAQIEQTRRARAAIAIANWLLSTFAPNYAQMVSGAIEYGLRAAAVHARIDAPTPTDWRVTEEPRWP